MKKELNYVGKVVAIVLAMGIVYFMGSETVY